MASSPLDTNHIGLLLDLLCKKAPKMVENAERELAALKKAYCDEYLQNYAENYGVPRDCHNWTTEELERWVRAREQIDGVR